MFGPEDLGQFRRFAAALATTIRPDGTIKSGSQAAAGVVAKAADVLAGMVAFKVGGPGAAGAAYGAKAGQRAVFDGIGASSARRSFEGSAPQLWSPGPAFLTDRIAVGAGIAARQR